MSEQQRESSGKTVDEAIREALLRMGLRREEVEVTVLQEARSGILGMGRREAVVRVVKKSDKGKQVRGRRQDRAENRPGTRAEAQASGRSGGRSSNQAGGRSTAGSEGRGRQGAESLSDEPAERRERQLAVRSRSEQGQSSGAEERRVRAGKKETRHNTGQRAQKKQDVEVSQPPDPGPALRADGEPGRHPEQEDTESRRRRRPRRRRKKTGAGAEGETAVAESAAPAPEAGNDLSCEDKERSAPAGTTEAAPAASQPAEHPAEPGMGPLNDQAVDAGDIALDIVAHSRCEPWSAADAAQAGDFLQRVATELMVKSGFPCRVQVQEGEYHHVKMVVDDRGAGILIGRYGNTVDAIEHLVEKIASKAAGDRVRMNLDINNYRLRCEDHLVQRARSAAAEARQTGQPVGLEPAGGRERRIVHLYIQECDDLVTYTETGPDGKYVVICRQDQVPEEHRKTGECVADEQDSGAGRALDIDVGAVIDVDAGTGGHQGAPQGR